MVILPGNGQVMKMEVGTVSIEESGLSRWSRLKKARKDRGAKRQESELTGESKAVSRGKAAPTAYPTEVSGEYRPWLPPLTEEKADSLPAEAEHGVDQEKDASTDGVLNAEETAIAEEMNLPEIESLEKESDYTVFLKDGVPEKLRRLALRKLWSSNPLFGFRDGLNDYDEDFTVLSDYVYNTAAMKDVSELKTQGEGEPEPSEGEEKQQVKQPDETQQAETVPESDGKTEDERSSDISKEQVADEPEVEGMTSEDDDPELG